MSVVLMSFPGVRGFFRGPIGTATAFAYPLHGY